MKPVSSVVGTASVIKSRIVTFTYFRDCVEDWGSKANADRRSDIWSNFRKPQGFPKPSTCAYHRQDLVTAITQSSDLMI
jgi:hypothetical protein